MQLQLSFYHVTKSLVGRQITTGALVTLSFPWMVQPRNDTNCSVRTLVSTLRGYQYFCGKRKRIGIQHRLGSFTGFDPITGNVGDVDAPETLLGALPTPSSGSLSVDMLRFENQFRLLSKQQATIELNSLLHRWYENLPTHSYIPTTVTKSVKEMYNWVESMRPDFEPNVSTYQTLLEAFLKRVDNMELAELILDRMLENLLAKRREAKLSGNPLPVPCDDTLEITSVMYSFHKIMKLYGRNNNPFAAEQLLHKLENTCHEYSVPILSNDSYTLVITNWAKTGKPREAEHSLYSMLNLKDKTLKHSGMIIAPSRENFSACLNAWVAYPTKVSGQRAELLVLKMVELSENGSDTKPNYKSYSKIVHAWVNSRHDHALVRVDKIMETLERMDWSSEADNQYGAQTVAETYLAAMRACSYRDKSKLAVKMCVDYLSRLDKVLGLEKVDYETLQFMYAALIYTYAQSGIRETETRVEEIFTELDARHKNYVAEKIARKAGEEEDYDPCISIAVYRALLHAYSRTGSGHKAEAVLKRMMHEYVDMMDKPTVSTQSRMVDTSCFNSVLLAWSRSKEPDAGQHAEKLFRQMYQAQSSTHMTVRVDVVSYNAVLSAMSGSMEVDVARRGDAYFKRILESSDPICRATAVTYTKAISLWSKIGTKEALDRADEILNEMKTSYNTKIKPTKTTYKAYLEVLINCKSFLPPEEYKIRIQDTNRLMNKL